MSERQHKKARKNLAHARIIYLQSEGEYGEPPRKRPLPPRAVGKGDHAREVPADYPNRAQRRGSVAMDEIGMKYV